ncbi:MAG: hypothetical protein ACUVUG_09480 [Candidatus Aminicenantia bacterium]
MKKFFLISILFSFLFFPLYPQKEEIIKIPKQIVQIMDQNILERKGRIDIPVEFIGYLYFPSPGENLFIVLTFRLKNASIFSSEIEGEMMGEMDFFLRFYSFDGKGNHLKAFKEIYLPLKETVEKEKYNSEESHFYSIFQTIPPGKYILSYSIASPDLKKITVDYADLFLPDLKKIETLQTTPLFFVKSLKILDAPVTEANIGKESFSYGRLEITPYFSNNYKGDETLELFYFLLGASTSPKGTYDFEIKYTVKKGEEEKVKFAPLIYENQRAPIISHPIPIFSSERKLEKGNYYLQISVKDKNSGKTFEGKIDFSVVEEK